MRRVLRRGLRLGLACLRIIVLALSALGPGIPPPPPSPRRQQEVQEYKEDTSSSRS
jgi:hypothetical protein